MKFPIRIQVYWKSDRIYLHVHHLVTQSVSHSDSSSVTNDFCLPRNFKNNSYITFFCATQKFSKNVVVLKRTIFASYCRFSLCVFICYYDYQYIFMYVCLYFCLLDSLPICQVTDLVTLNPEPKLELV